MADVIIADGKLTPHASVSQVTLDWACGTDENDFELTIDDPDAPEIEHGWYFWLDGSDVGGRIIDRRVTVSGGRVHDHVDRPIVDRHVGGEDIAAGRESGLPDRLRQAA